jgi:hypothetical protein
MTSPAPADPLCTADTSALLQRVLAVVENDTRRGRLELALAIILSLATLASTWCGYQAQSWAGVASTSQSAADTAERQAAEDTIVGLQLRTFDGIALLNYWTALRAGDTQSQELILAHVRPQLRRAIEAAIADGILTSPGRTGPLQRPEYVLVEEQEAARLRKEAGVLNTAAANAGRYSGAYVMLTLMFASVLFFGGITGTFRSRRVRVGLATIALAVFVLTVTNLVGLPVHAG